MEDILTRKGIMMRIAIGADHRGFVYKQWLQKNLPAACGNTIEWVDVGAFDKERSDYPLYAIYVAEAVQAGTVDRGVLLCGSGVGMCIAANRFKGVYAALVWNESVARQSHEHDKSNVIVLPADYISEAEACSIVVGWLSAHFLGGRHADRIAMIDQLPALSKGK